MYKKIVKPKAHHALIKVSISSRSTLIWPVGPFKPSLKYSISICSGCQATRNKEDKYDYIKLYPGSCSASSPPAMPLTKLSLGGNNSFYVAHRSPQKCLNKFGHILQTHSSFHLDYIVHYHYQGSVVLPIIGYNSGKETEEEI